MKYLSFNRPPAIEWHAYPRFEIIEYGGRWDRFSCTHPGSVTVGETRIEFEVGWITDAASVPKALRSIVDQLGPHLPAALIHDWMLDNGYSRDVARAALDLQLQHLPAVSAAQRRAIVWGVWVYDRCVVPLRRK